MLVKHRLWNIIVEHADRCFSIHFISFSSPLFLCIFCPSGSSFASPITYSFPPTMFYLLNTFYSYCAYLCQLSPVLCQFLLSNLQPFLLICRLCVVSVHVSYRRSSWLQRRVSVFCLMLFFQSVCSLEGFCMFLNCARIHRLSDASVWTSMCSSTYVGICQRV